MFKCQNSRKLCLTFVGISAHMRKMPHRATIDLQNRSLSTPAVVRCVCGYRHVHPETTSIEFLLRQCDLHDDIETDKDAARLDASELTWEQFKAQRTEKREERNDQRWADARAWHDAISKEANPGLPKR